MQGLKKNATPTREKTSVVNRSMRNQTPVGKKMIFWILGAVLSEEDGATLSSGEREIEGEEMEGGEME